MYLRVFLCSSESQKKVQELKQRNEELEEKIKQQNKCEFEEKIPKNQPRPSITISY